jgi:DNA-binding SARP family transcriptional activator
MLRLCTFGGLTLLVDGSAVTGALTQRRQLALLALLAVTRTQGMSRDKVLSYLWPERDTETARHILNQQLYSQRRSEGDQLFVGRKTLRLNPAMFECDLWSFEDARRAGRFEAAVDSYRGPFLDGFHLREAGEFEEWVEGQRRRLRREHLEALEQLSRIAESTGSLDDLLRWRSRAMETDPLDGTAALALARTLLLRNDRPAAIRELRDYATRVRTVLEVDPHPEVQRLLAELGRESAHP